MQNVADDASVLCHFAPQTKTIPPREAWTALEAIIPLLFQGKGPGDQVRVWVTACATGEEAYTVAMLLAEHADTLDHPPQVQVFATDIDDAAIRRAR
jgi:two-component system CheB/CheR fusion protein